MRVGQLRPDITLAELQLDRRADILPRSRVVNQGLVIATAGHLDIPGDFVVGIYPVREEGTVGRFAAAPNVTIADAVAGGQYRRGKIGIADREGPVILWGFGQYLLLPACNLISEPGCYLGFVLRNIAVLPRVGLHIEQLALIIEPISLGSDADTASLMRENHTVRPFSGLLQKKRLEAGPIERLVADDWDLRYVGQGREKVDCAGNLRYYRAGLDSAGPTNHTGHTDAALVGRAFSPFHAIVPPPTVRAVVAEIDNDCFFGKLQFIKPAENSSDVPVDVFAHCQGAAGPVELLGLGVAVAHFDWAALELFVEAGGHRERRVGRVVRQITQEGLISVFLDKRQGVVGQIVDDESFSSHDFAVVFEYRVEIMPPVPGAEAVEIVETACVGMVGILRSVVPFSKSRGRIAGGLERLADCFLVEVQTFGPGRYASHAAAWMVSAGQKLGPRRCADRTDEKPIE